MGGFGKDETPKHKTHTFLGLFPYSGLWYFCSLLSTFSLPEKKLVESSRKVSSRPKPLSVLRSLEEKYVAAMKKLQFGEFLSISKYIYTKSDALFCYKSSCSISCLTCLLMSSHQYSEREAESGYFPIQLISFVLSITLHSAMSWLITLFLLSCNWFCKQVDVWGHCKWLDCNHCLGMQTA